jgi:hypothetical protein
MRYCSPSFFNNQALTPPPPSHGGGGGMGTIALITPARRHNGKPLFHSSPTFSILKSVGMPEVVLSLKVT